MNKLTVLRATILILFFGIASSFGQTVSEEAKRHFDRGMAAVEMAKSPDDYAPAIKEFEQAASLAPGWPDVYYSLGMVQEKAEKYSDAVTNLKQYLRLAPNASDAETVKSLINKLEYKAEQEEGVKRVYEMMTLVSCFGKRGGIYERKLVDSKKLNGSEPGPGTRLYNFRMVSGEMQVRNDWYVLAAEGHGYSSELHPPIPREWEPVKVNGRFYEYTFSYYMGIQTGYVVREDFEVKGEVLSIDPPRIKETIKYSATWGVPFARNRPPWSADDNYGGTKEYTYELIRE